MSAGEKKAFVLRVDKALDGLEGEISLLESFEFNLGEAGPPECETTEKAEPTFVSTWRTLPGRVDALSGRIRDCRSRLTDSIYSE